MIRISNKILNKEKPNVFSQEGLEDNYFRTFGYSFVEVHRYEELDYYFKYEGDLNSYFSLWILGIYSIIGKSEGTNKEPFTENFVYHKFFQLENNSGVAMSRNGLQCDNGSIKRIDDQELYPIYEKKDLNFRKMMTVGHYTKMETVLEHILPDNKLLINNFMDSNDPWEYRQNCYTIFEISKFCPDLLDQYINARQMQDDFLNRVRFISLTKDTNSVKSFDQPVMWAHYGQKHKGICLVFDLNELKKIFITQFKKNTKFGSIKYKTIENKPISIENDISLEVVFDKYAKYLLYEKMKDWKNEEEFRFVTFDNTEDCSKKSYLQNIDNAVIAIIAGANFNNTYKCVINEYLTNRANNNRNKIEFFQIVFINGQFRIKDLYSDNQTHPCNEMLNDYIIENE